MASLRLPILFYSILVDATQAACSCAYAKRLLLVWSAIGSETEARLVSRRAHFRYLCLMIIIEPLPLSLSYLPRLASPRLVSLSCALCLVPAHHTVPASFILLAFTCLHHPRSHSYYCRCASLLSLTYAAAQPLTNNQAYSHRKPLLDATLLLLLLLLTRRLSLPTPHDRSHLLEIVCSRASFAFSLYLSRTPWCAACGSSRLASTNHARRTSVLLPSPPTNRLLHTANTNMSIPQTKPNKQRSEMALGGLHHDDPAATTERAPGERQKPLSDERDISLSTGYAPRKHRNAVPRSLEHVLFSLACSPAPLSLVRLLRCLLPP